MGSSARLNEIIHEKHWTLCLAYSRCSINVTSTRVMMQSQFMPLHEFLTHDSPTTLREIKPRALH